MQGCINTSSRPLATGSQRQGQYNSQQVKCCGKVQHCHSVRRHRLAVSCIYAGNEGQHRRELERRSALALSCTERQTSTADLLGSFNQTAAGLSTPRRLRIAVDVDEGELTAAARHCVLLC